MGQVPSLGRQMFKYVCAKYYCPGMQMKVSTHYFCSAIMLSSPLEYEAVIVSGNLIPYQSNDIGQIEQVKNKFFAAFNTKNPISFAQPKTDWDGFQCIILSYCPGGINI